MIKDIPAGVSRVLLAQGAVYLRTTRALLDEGLSLDVGSARSHFREIPEDEITNFGVAIEYRPELDADALGEINGLTDEEEPPLDAMLNELKDWILPDHATLQFRYRKTGQPIRYDVGAPIILPGGQSDLEFSAYLGAHRSAARLQIRLADAEGHVLHEADLPFDMNHHGGTHMIGYKQVLVELPPCPEGTCTLHMSVLFDRFAGKDDDAEPYLFVADPKVQRRGRADATPAEDLHTSPGAEGKNMVWASAELASELKPTHDLSLVAGDMSAS